MRFDPRRRPHVVGEKLVSFPTLRKEFVWPAAVAPAIKEALALDDPGVLPSAVLELLRSQGVVVEESESILGAFPGFTLTSLSLDDLPESGPFLFPGDPQGGFYARHTGAGTIPCPRCLMRRYLAGRQAGSLLYQAVQEGADVQFEPCSDLAELSFDGEQVVFFGARPGQVWEVLPVPDCQVCASRLGEFSEKALEVGPFSPLTRSWVSERGHTVQLPAMQWLVGEETVGGGSAWSPDPETARLKANHEALERYSAHFRPQDMHFVNREGERRLFPVARPILTEPGSVSTGLACRLSLEDAVRDGLREVCERDALAHFWLKAEAGEPSCKLLGKVGEVTLLCLPSFEWPTVVAMGADGQGRLFFGSACGELEDAKDKAVQECRQNQDLLSEKPREAVPTEPDSFWEHALYYWGRPELFPELSYLTESTVTPLSESVWWLELTPPDLRRLGYHAVRVHVPGLLYTPMSHRDWPTLLQGRHKPPQRPHPFA